MPKVSIRLLWLIGLFVLTGGAGAAAPSPTPTFANADQYILTMDGKLAQVIVSACERLKQTRKIDCSDKDVQNRTIRVYVYSSHYMIEFFHLPPRNVDDSYGVDVKIPAN